MGRTERLREGLHEVAMKKGLNSQEAIKASHLLDLNVNEYYCHQRQQHS
jgi:hypothetical protein